MFRALYKLFVMYMYLKFYLARAKIACLVACAIVKEYIVRTLFRRCRVTALGDRKYHVKFYMGDIECNMVVKRTSGPVRFYHAVSENGEDVYSELCKYVKIVHVQPTPEMLGYERIDAWDMMDTKIVFNSADTLYM